MPSLNVIAFVFALHFVGVRAKPQSARRSPADEHDGQQPRRCLEDTRKTVKTWRASEPKAEDGGKEIHRHWPERGLRKHDLL